MTAKKGGGGRLTRSETVTVRLDPKLRYLAELGARKHRRTLSSYIEWAIEDSLKKITLKDELREQDKNLSELSSELWDVYESDRFVKLAFICNELLTHEEQVLWKLVSENGYFWRGRYNDDEWIWEVDPRKLIWDRLREKWELLKAVAEGERDEADLPSVVKKSKDPIFDPDDEIPF